jgi:hypothetical protein
VTACRSRDYDAAPERTPIRLRIASVLPCACVALPVGARPGIETGSASIAQRSIAWNGVGTAAPHAGDWAWRRPTASSTRDRHAAVSADRHGPRIRRVQKGPAFRASRRTEAYCETAARVLAPDGTFVVCEQAAQDARVEAAAGAAGLAIAETLPVVPRAGKPPLFCVHVVRRRRSRARASARRPPLVVRDERGVRTPDCRAMRAAMGLPP